MKLLSSALLVLLLQAAPATTKGAVSFKGTSMPIVDALGAWNATTNELVVALMPFKIEKKDHAEILKDRIFFAVFGHESPDKKKWPDRCPFASLKLKLDPKDLAAGPKAIQTYLFVAYGFKEKNFTHNINRQTEAALKEFKTLVVKLDAKGSGTVELAFKGEESFDKELTWDFSVLCPVLPAIPEK